MPHCLMTQLVGHARTLQARVSAVCAQAAPPCVGCVLVRVRDCVPAPHEVVQVDQTAGNEPSTQSIGHAPTKLFCPTTHVSVSVHQLPAPAAGQLPFFVSGHTEPP